SLARHFSFSSTPSSPTATYTLSLHDALPISQGRTALSLGLGRAGRRVHPHRRHRLPGRQPALHLEGLRQYVDAHGRPHARHQSRSEEHTSELQSRFDLVCRLLLEKKKNKQSE